MLGFWIYLMSDCLIFAILFATYGVLGAQLRGGPSPADLFDLPLVALNTAMLLFSSITYGFAMLEMEEGKHATRRRSGWPSPACSALAFLGIELYEFGHLIHEGATPQRSAFLSAFFTLVGTHGLHVTFGIDLAGHADGAGRQARPDPGQPAPPDVPEPVLALPRRRSGSASSPSSI